MKNQNKTVKTYLLLYTYMFLFMSINTCLFKCIEFILIHFNQFKRTVLICKYDKFNILYFKYMTRFTRLNDTSS